nr:hypothetical protein [Tanacetum cinerariifolium]GEX46240.1 hypothetical protein [Tanacetum cinerariifolium]
APRLLVCWGMMVEGSGDSVKWWGVAGIGGSGFVESGGKVGRMNSLSLQEGRTVPPRPSLYIPERKQLAINLGDEYGFVICPCLVGVTFESMRIDLWSDSTIRVNQRVTISPIEIKLI